MSKEVVIKAPKDWPFMDRDLESIDGMSPNEAIRHNRVKTAPYVVKGKRYVPMSVAEAKTYKEEGTGSWYGYETLYSTGGYKTFQEFMKKQFFIISSPFVILTILTLLS